MKKKLGCKNMEIIAVFMLFTTLFPKEQDDISFLYAMLGRSNPTNDTTMVLQDSSIIHTGDEVRIYAGYEKGTYFYVIFKGSDGEFALLYPKKNHVTNLAPELPDTIFTTVLHWTQFDDPAGQETFFLINSYNEQNDILNLFKPYDTVNVKGKKKLAKKIQNEIEKINPERKRELNSIAGGLLDKPIVGGLTYRSDGTDEIMDASLTHNCLGSSGIAFKKIILNHQ